MYIEVDNKGKKTIPAGNSWRMVIVNDNIVSLNEASVQTSTENPNIKFFVAASKDECVAEATSLGLADQLEAFGPKGPKAE